MTLAFGALLIGSSAALNQIGYLLIVGVLIDCFITTKIIIPCAMALLPGDSNFWPRKRPPPPPKLGGAAGHGLSGGGTRITHISEDWEPAD